MADFPHVVPVVWQLAGNVACPNVLVVFGRPLTVAGALLYEIAESNAGYHFRLKEIQVSRCKHV